jgi:hypothetical protein
MDSQEFANKVRSRHPHKWICSDTSFILGDNLYFAMDTYDECQLPLADKHKVASHVLNATSGFVIKDSDALFTTFGMGVPCIPIPASNIDWGMLCESTPTLAQNIPKCVCGSKSVGSNKHSSYCEIKGDI